MIGPSLSLLYPIHDRAHLFRPTLTVFRDQLRAVSDRRHFLELVVVDDRSSDGLDTLCREFGDELPIRYLRADARLVRDDVCLVGEHINPSYVQNVGLKAAAGDRVVLSSPEIFHTSPRSLEVMATTPMTETECLVGDAWDESMATFICGGPNEGRLAFLSVFPRQGLLASGGVEEDFLTGIGYDDNDLEWRWLARQGTFTFLHDRLTGYHQSHERIEMKRDQYTRVAYERSKRLWFGELYPAIQKGMRISANVGREWGSGVGVLDEWTSSAWHPRL